VREQVDVRGREEQTDADVAELRHETIAATRSRSAR
jgi:hypothetical protein